MVDGSSGGFGPSQAPSTVFSVSRRIASSRTLAGSLELFSGLFHELIVAAVRRAAAL